MTGTNELEAIKARVKELEASPAPFTGWGGLLSLIGSVVALVPRWLFVAAGVVFVAWLGFELYNNGQQIAATTIQENYKAVVTQQKEDVTPHLSHEEWEKTRNQPSARYKDTAP